MSVTNEPIKVSRFEIVAPDFFFLPLRKLTVESDPNTNRVYMLKGERIVAVCRRKEDDR